MKSPQFEFRDHGGMIELTAARDVSGRRCLTRVRIECPFCGAQTDAHRWSLAGSGKRCSGDGCTAVLGQTHASRRLTK